MILNHNSLGKKKFRKIVSLVPSQTELLYDLGLEKEVIGITKFCIHPDTWFRIKTRVGGTKRVNIEMIDRLLPDLIIANKEENVKEQIEELAKKYEVWVTDINDLNDAIIMISDIGKLTAKEKEADDLSNKIKYGFEDLEKKILSERKIRAAYLIWKNPYMAATGGTFINEMMHYCRLENIFSNQNRYPQISLEKIEEMNCEMIILSSEPYPFKQKHKEELQNIFPEIHVELADGEMFSWYGSRLLKSIDYFHSFLKKMNSI